jgi:hypothetical protein
MNKIRTGDDVMVLAGRDKGQRGSVVKVLDDGRLIVQGVNMVKRHTKPNPMQNQPRSPVAPTGSGSAPSMTGARCVTSSRTARSSTSNRRDSH